MAVRDDRSDVKQTTAGFWASDGPRPSFVKSKFLSLALSQPFVEKCTLEGRHH
ncbi:MAG: hypothetical protein QF728_03860 [Arenicellales bacterium]|nr:hypothetical protein [Arenicellales bacterium]